MKKKKNKIAKDAWYEIFLRLPLDSVFRSKSVSKVWLSDLSDPYFINQWYELNHLSLPWALVQYTDQSVCDDPVKNEYPRKSPKDKWFRKTFTIAYPDSHSHIVSQNPNGFSFNFLNPIFPDRSGWKDINLLSSSNGLVLCRLVFDHRSAWCVCNPLAQKWVPIPPPPRRKTEDVTGLVCNDKCFSSSLVSTSFKVIRIPRFEATEKEFEIEMFSSELGEWNICHVSCPQGVSWDFAYCDNFITHNGVFYWFQKRSLRILAVSVNGNTNHGYKCRLINIPEGAMYYDLDCCHRLGESEGMLCYAILNEKKKSLSVWVLEEDWCLLYKDDNIHDKLAEMETYLTGGVGTDNLITHSQVLGFSPVDKYVVILGYKWKYVWAYNTRTKGYEQLSHPSFLCPNGSVLLRNFLTFALKPRPSVLPPVSWGDTSMFQV